MKIEETDEQITATTFESINDLIVDAIQDMKGLNILKFDLRKLDEKPADYFIICEGTSTTQVRSIASFIQKRVKEEMPDVPISKEGADFCQWVLVDFFDTVVHIFHPETRAFYELEELWSDAEITEYENL